MPTTSPRGPASERDPEGTVVLAGRGLGKSFPVRAGGRRRIVRAVDDVSFAIAAGETYALVGESGSGKSTVARMVARLLETSDGTVELLGKDITRTTGRALKAIRPQIQLVFQDPSSALNPSFRLIDLISEPWRVQSTPWTREQVVTLLDEVGLSEDLLERYPHQLSGGQRQRAVIARALAMAPSVLVLDEPVAALDVSVQAQVINLLRDLQRRRGLGYLFIAHDLGVVANLADRVGVMYLGRLVEEGTAEQVLSHPQHPYTRALVSAIPVEDPALRDQPGRVRLIGDPPSPLDVVQGCAFAPRCAFAHEQCRRERPVLTAHAGVEQAVACLRVGELSDS